MAEGREAVVRVGGYVLAGGRSSRMGRDKALLELGGRPLIAHAVTKLRRVTGEANILAGEPPGNTELRGFGPQVFDLHPGCGPMAGLEAALAHSAHEWNLILPVDVPFLPAAYLEWWVSAVTRGAGHHSAVALFQVDGVPQPALLVVHREVRPYLSAAIVRGAYKLYPVLEEAARQLALPEAAARASTPHLFPVDKSFRFSGLQVPPARLKPWQMLSEAQRLAQPLWFANLNTPDEFARAAKHVDALDAAE